MLKNKIRTAVLVSSGGTNLQAIIDAEAGGIIKTAEVVLVISSKNGAYALTRAKNAGIDTLVADYRSLGSQESFENAIISALDEYKIDLIVFAGFMSILSENFTRRYPMRMINVHPSLIPSFCGKGFYGLRVHEAALNYGVKITGATVHFVNEVPDGGQIIMQRAVAIRKGDTPESLQKRVMIKAEHIILPQAVELVARTRPWEKI